MTQDHAMQMYKNLEQFTLSDSPMARWSLAFVMIIN